MPSTEMYTMMLEETGVDYWRDFVLQPHDQLVPRPKCDMTDAEIQRWARLGYLRFYYRPKMMWRQLSRMRSFGEVQRSVQTAVQMLREHNLGEDATGMEVLA
jgi:hypothetical protein